MIPMDFIGVCLMLSGYVIGLGAVTVIDLHGFLGRRSAYWTEAATRTHKVTKPMIWAGIGLALIGGVLLYRNEPFVGVPLVHFLTAIALISNGLFLSFRVSPFLIERERRGASGELIPPSWQQKIAVSLIVSDLGWWGGLFLFAWYLLQR